MKDPVEKDFYDYTAYTRKELYQLILREKPNLSESTFRWTLYDLQRKHKLFRTDYDTYMTTEPSILPEYRPFYTDRAKKISSRLSDRFSEIEYVIFEGVLLNEFLNHQIVQNTIYIQVEKDISSYVSDTLQQEYGGIILRNPTRKEFDRYWIRDCIVVLDLISQAPLNTHSPHDICIEKMLVDILAEKSIAATFSPSELPTVFENIQNCYRIYMRKVNRYAGRRGKTEEVKRYMEGLRQNAFERDAHG